MADIAHSHNHMTQISYKNLTARPHSVTGDWHCPHYMDEDLPMSLHM